ncbi:MAG: GMC family oxidoreductase N-terminal domain-containing protein [Proteobacteria bacterium]|nr:GMC family oxidoreductase N-terminal domain-containing protein [Pseudomonadota bacterium]
METSFDYIVIGAGSAGCAVAGRLADSGASVAVLEAGGADHGGIVTVPMGIAITARRPHVHNYAYRTEPQPALNGRRGHQPRGRGLGGSSSINGMVYVRGTPSDYDGWAALGAQGWAWQDVLPYFRRSEGNERFAGRNDDLLHSGAGPLRVVDPRSPNPFARAFVEAAESVGYDYNHDFNGERQEGVGHYQVTQRNGERWNAARAYLHGGDPSSPSKGRANLHVLTHCQVLRIVFDDARRAVAVELQQGNGQVQVLQARREIVLSAGAFNSPQLLMASGIGPAEHLRQLGVPVVAALEGVGRNLQEHPDIALNTRVDSTDLFGISLGGAWRMLGEFSRYRRLRSGMLSSAPAEAGGFIKSRPDALDPDLQLHFVQALASPRLQRGHGHSTHVCVLRPYSRGEVRLASPDMRDAPVIDQRMLSDERDMQLLVEGVRIVKRILAQPALARFGGAALGHAHFDHLADDATIREFIMERTDSVFHPVGTCRMGSDAQSVLDPQLRVRGVLGLRVVDASVMPTLIGGNTNAPAIMIGEKAADLMLDRPAPSRHEPIAAVAA